MESALLSTELIILFPERCIDILYCVFWAQTQDTIHHMGHLSQPLSTVYCMFCYSQAVPCLRCNFGYQFSLSYLTNILFARLSGYSETWHYNIYLMFWFPPFFGFCVCLGRCVTNINKEAIKSILTNTMFLVLQHTACKEKSLVELTFTQNISDHTFILGQHPTNQILLI